MKNIFFLHVSYSVKILFSIAFSYHVKNAPFLRARFIFLF